MYASATKIQIHLDKMDEAVRIFQNEVVPAIKAFKGLQHFFLLTDAKTGKGSADTARQPRRSKCPPVWPVPSTRGNPGSMNHLLPKLRLEEASDKRVNLIAACGGGSEKAKAGAFLEGWCGASGSK
jgi:hypothetical protein